MLRHVVLIDFVPGLAEEQVTGISARVRELPGRVPGVLSASCGRDAGLTKGGGDFAIIVDLVAADGYPDYVADPAHQELAAALAPCVRGRTVVDFEL